MLTSQKEKQTGIMYLLVKSCQRNWTQIESDLCIWLPICRKYKRLQQYVELHQKYASAKARACEIIVKPFSSSTDQMKEKGKDEEGICILKET